MRVRFANYLFKDISTVSLTGLEGTAYVDKVEKGQEMSASSKPITFGGETDRVYTKVEDPYTSILEDGKKRFELVRDALTDIVVWNPWIEKAEVMSDFEPKRGYKNMLCVEAGSVNRWLTLEGGDTWEGGQTIKAL